MELQETDWSGVRSTKYSLEPAGRSRQGGDAVRVSVVLENLTEETVTKPICYLYFGDRSIGLIEFDTSKTIAPGDLVRLEGVARFRRELRGESENILCRPP